MGPVAVYVNLLIQRTQFLFPDVRIYDGKFIAVKPVHGRLGGQKLLNTLCKLTQHGITEDMAVPVFQPRNRE